MTAVPLWRQVLKLRAQVLDHPAAIRTAQREAFEAGVQRGLLLGITIAGGQVAEQLRAGATIGPAPAVVDAAWQEWRASV